MIVFGLGLWAYPRSIGFTEVSFSTQVTDIINYQKSIAKFKQTLFFIYHIIDVNVTTVSIVLSTPLTSSSLMKLSSSLLLVTRSLPLPYFFRISFFPSLL